MPFTYLSPHFGFGKCRTEQDCKNKTCGLWPAVSNQELGGQREKPGMEPEGQPKLLCLEIGTEMRRPRSRATNTWIKEVGSCGRIEQAE